MPKKEEANDIAQYLLPSLGSVNIAVKQCKIDTSTDKSGKLRGDIWISRAEQASGDFEKNIIALIEAKHRKCELGDMDWREAMAKGKEKAQKQGLSFYIVTNCIDTHRFYNASTDDEIALDDKPITQFQPMEVLERIQTQVSATCSYVVYKTTQATIPVLESDFRRSLHKLADIYRSCGLKKGDERIDPTVSFVVMKYIGDKEKETRTLGQEVKTWDEYGSGRENYKADFSESRKDIFSGEYGGTYQDFKELVSFPTKLKNEHYKQIYEELSQYHFRGFNFDVFGTIYEEFASQTKKKEFGEFYTRRHITRLVARLLLRKEITARDLKICDPACGTGGFLTEAYKTLINNYTQHGRLDEKVRNKLKDDTFWGFDNDEKSVARTQLNMFLVDDGHTHIKWIDDSLASFESSMGWEPERFDYMMTNPPMGTYKGEAKIENFKWPTEKRNEMLFLERVVDATKPGCEIAIVVNDGMLETPTRENFRIKLLKNCDVHAIISLTPYEFAPYTKEKTYILFLQKKQQAGVGTIQEFPIWHFIVDYDGFANSDKRYRTKWHDDLPEWEEKFNDALELARCYVTDRTLFNAQRNHFEREVNQREKQEGLTGKKCGFLEMGNVSDSNFHNMLSEFHLRPVEIREMTEAELDQQVKQLFQELRNALKKVEELDQGIRGSE